MNDYSNWKEEWKKRRMQQNPNSRIWAGFFLILIGAAALAKIYFFNLPYWLFTWPMILIIVGVYSGIKHNFRNNAWWILILIGSYFLMDDIFPDVFDRRYFWPVALIAFGIIMIVKPKRRWDLNNCDISQPKQSNDTTTGTGSTNKNETTANDAEDFLDAVAVFGGIKKSVFSKNFKGGKITCVFGGGEINLLQADFTGTAVIELNAIFGGCTLLIPSNWQLRTEPAAIFGGIDDKRSQAANISTDKVLVLNGTVMFGGVEIKSY